MTTTKTTIHFAGVNTPMLSAVTEGRPILISYADVLRRPTWWQHEMKPRLEAGAYTSVILDSGAFTVISAGITIDVLAYARFAQEHAHLFSLVVGLDDIAGDLATTWGNQAVLEAHGVAAMPVFHQGEPLEVLDHYLSKYDAVGVGFARKQGGRLAHDQKTNTRFLAAFFARVQACGRKVAIHGFAMTSYATRGWAFTTTDSTTWIAEYRGLRTQTPEAPVVTDHGIGDDLAAGLDWFTDAELCELVLESYAPAAAPAGEISADSIAEWELWIEDQAKGQARTVGRRFGGERLAWAVDVIETRKCAAYAGMTVAAYTHWVKVGQYEEQAALTDEQRAAQKAEWAADFEAGYPDAKPLWSRARGDGELPPPLPVEPELEPDPDRPRCELCGEERELELLEWWPDERAFLLSTCCEAYQDAMHEELADPELHADKVWRRGFVAWFAEQTGGADVRRPYTRDGHIRLDYGLRLEPITLQAAKAFILEHHRHNRPPVSWRWGHAVWNGADLVAVAMVGRPVARMLDHTTSVEVNRLCVDPDLAPELVWNACSMLYGEAAREAARRGFSRILTYTLETEPGTALKACGWTAAAKTAGGSWNRAGRERADTAPTCPKVRWERELRPARPARTTREAA